MTKELVISSNKHETRVALLEDDQLVEIFFQRGSEYSLAGSIHKGRVTRVLPGMQSAFVNIGLERDAFLYVSDFFDDSEEYDKVVTGVEDKVAEMQNAARTAAAGGSREADLEAPPEMEAERDAAPQLRPALEQESRDRRGRRSRRRRFRDRGFPESKYASEVSAGPEEESEGGYGEEEESPSIMPILPGESLAKYAGRSWAQTPATEAERISEILEEDISGEEVASVGREIAEDSDFPLTEEAGGAGGQAPESGESASNVAEERLAAEEQAKPAGPSEQEDTAPAPESAAVLEEPRQGRGRRYRRMRSTRFGRPLERSGFPVEEPAEAVASTEEPGPAEAEDAPPTDRTALESAFPEESLPAQAAEDQEAAAAAKESLAAAGEPEDLGAVDQDELQVDREENDSSPELGGEDPVSAPGDEGAAAAEAEEPEPARMPHSLTATLREQGQGPRYLQQRISRRLRKRMRRGGAETAEGRPELRREEEREEKPPRGEEKPTAQASITDLLKEGQEIIVQIAKEPLGQKGARITSHIALPGRYVVYMPTVDHVGVSRKIPSDQERIRLKRILQANRAGIPGGFIVRTAGEGKTERQIAEDMQYLFNLWLDIRQKAEKKPAPVLLFHDLDVVQRVLRDYVTSDFKNIWVDTEEVYESVANFLHRFQPTLLPRLRLYTRKEPIFDAFNISSELEKALRPKIWLKSGGYIVINQTEALVAIDINTGKFVGKSNRLEDTIVKTNIEAVKEIARQIRLRDLGGIIVVDFIDMEERKNRQKVMQALEEAMRADRAPSKILQFNDFGLVAITRKRTKQSLERTLCEPCPYCEGSAYVKSVRTVIGEILEYARQYAPVVEGKDVMLRVAPQVAKVLKSRENNYLEELEEILGRPVLVTGDPQLHQEKFDMA